MPTRIYGYRKAMNEFTVITLREPDRAEQDAPGVTELATLDGVTYVAIPDGVVLPEQPVEITATLAEVTLTEELREAIKSASPHVQLINERVVERIRERYTINDELKHLRLGLDDPETAAYNAYAEECRAWGRAEKERLGLA